MGNVKDADFYKDLYVLNSMETMIGENRFEVKLWADDMEVWKNGTMILEENPIMAYKEGEEILKLVKKEIPSNTKVIRKISEDMDSWYVQIILTINEKGIATIKRSYFQNDGTDTEDWVESENVEMSLSDAVELFTVVMAEIENSDLDF